MEKQSDIGQLQIVKKNAGSIWSTAGWCQINEKTHEPVYGKGSKYTKAQNPVEPPFDSTGFIAVVSQTPVEASSYLLRSNNFALNMAESISLAHQMPQELTHLILYTRCKSEENNDSLSPHTPEYLVKEYIDKYSPLIVYDALGITSSSSNIPVEWFTSTDNNKIGYNGPVTDKLLHDLTFEKIGQIAGSTTMSLFGHPDWDMGNYGEVMWTTGWGRKHTRTILKAMSLGKVTLPKGFEQFTFPYSSFDQQRLIKYGTCLKGIKIPKVEEEDILYKISLI